MITIDNPAATIVADLPVSLVKQLQSLEKKRVLSERRLLLWLAAPLLMAIPFFLGALIHSDGMLVFGVAWILVVLFGLGIYIHVLLPNTDDLARKYKKAVMPGLLKQLSIDGEYSGAHGLSVESFLKGGLYREHFSHFERYDCIIGKYNGRSFGLYELAVQVAGGRGGMVGMGVGVTPGYRVLTTHFYGWVLHVPTRKLSGKTWIIPSKRRTKHETDDWLKEVSTYLRSGEISSLLTSDHAFDEQFHVFSTDPKEAETLLEPGFRKFLLYAYAYFPNAPAFAFCDGRAYMHVGIRGTSFDPERGQPYYPAQTEALAERLRFFCAAILSLHTAAANARS